MKGGVKGNRMDLKAKKVEDLQKEREAILRIGDSFVLCLCVPVWECWGLYCRCQAARFLLKSTYSRNASNNSI